MLWIIYYRSSICHLLFVMCQLRITLLESSTLYTYGALSVLCGIIASLGNLIALYILMSEQRTKSNKILSSLAISDSLTGFIVFPLNAYQSFSKPAQSNCTIDLARSYFALVMIGSSVLTLVVVAIDRYILMTRFASYDIIVTRPRINVVLVICWLFPAVTGSLRMFSSTGILAKIYEFSMILIFFGPVLPLAVSYCLLVRLIYISRKRINSHALKISSIRKSSNEKFEMTLASHREGCAADARESPNNEETRKKDKGETRHLKLAKSVAVLLGCYILCLIPFNMWIVLDLTKALNPYVLQHLYVFAIFAGAVNSCINPFIYLSKRPGFKKSLGTIFRKIPFNYSSSDE